MTAVAIGAQAITDWRGYLTPGEEAMPKLSEGRFALAALAAFAIWAFVVLPILYGPSPWQNPQSPQQQPQPEQRGADQAPSIVQPQQSQQAQTETSNNTDQGPYQRSDGWFRGWTLSDKIAGIASTVAALQFLALVFTLEITRRTARSQLRAYIGMDKGEVINLDGDESLEVTMSFRNAGQPPSAQALHVWRNVDTTISRPR
jgi:hypothetical protein